MLLEAFFTPVNSAIVKAFVKQKNCLGAAIQINAQKFPSLKSVDIALIGLGDNANALRKELYALSPAFDSINIVDLGTLNHNGKNVQAALRECLLALFELGIKPIIIGENHRYAEALLKSLPYQKADLAIVSPRIAYNEDDLAFLMAKKKRLFHVSFIANQTFLNPQDLVQNSQEVFSEALRLGAMKQSIQAVEPLLRQADVFEFDLSAIKYSEFRSVTEALPNGLDNQEACAICRYAGISNGIEVFLFNQMDLSKKDATDAKQLAQMVWYCLDGLNNRFNDVPQINNRNFTVYKCHANSGEDMLFLYSEVSGRWWLQIPQVEGKKKTAAKFIGCTENDHQIAEQGEVPEKYYRALFNSL